VYLWYLKFNLIFSTLCTMLRRLLLLLGVFSPVTFTVTSTTCSPSLSSMIAIKGYRGGVGTIKKTLLSAANPTAPVTPPATTKRRSPPPPTQPVSNSLLTHEERQLALSEKSSLERNTPEDLLCTAAVDAVWKRHRRWSIVASRRRASVHRARVQSLFFLVAGASLQTIAVQTDRYALVARITGAACLGAAPLLTSACLSKEKISEWTRSRTISESIKRQVFTFRAGVAPYDGDRGTAAQNLVDEVAGISDSARDLNIYYALTRADDVPSPPKLDRLGYIHHRIDKQIDGFYKTRARKQARTSAFLKVCRNTLAGAAATVGFVTGSKAAVADVGAVSIVRKVATTFVNRVGIWGPALTAASAAFAAHIHESHYDEQVNEFTYSAQHLENLYLCLPLETKPGTTEWSDFVLDCESVIASSTSAWMSLQNLKFKKSATDRKK